MTVQVQLISLFVAAILPGVCGYGIVRLLFGLGHHKTLYVAHGYLMGILLLTLLAQLWDFAGIPLSFGLLATSLLLVATLGWWRVTRAAQDPRGVTTCHSTTYASWQFWVTFTLGCLIAIHLILLLGEVWLRPMFPWDAWRGWAPKAIQFFDQRSLSADMPTIANYGITTNVIQMWMMLATGETHQPWLNLPWVLAYISLLLATYGHLRGTCPPMHSMLGVYLVSSLPYLNIHTALAGYADIWLTASFTLGVLTLTLYRDNKRLGYLVATLVYVIMSIQTKRAGLGMGLILLMCTLVTVLHWTRLKLMIVSAVALAFLAAVCSALMGLIGIRMQIPFVGEFELTESVIRIPLVKSYALQNSFTIKPMLESLALHANWHIAAWLLLATLPMLLTKPRLSGLYPVIPFALFAGVAYQLAYFTFVSPASAADHTATSRALLYLMPLGLWWLVRMGYDALADIPSAANAHTTPPDRTL